MPGQANEARPVVYFQGKQKGMVLNKTNAAILAAAYGKETDGWMGRPCEIFAAMKTGRDGKPVEGLSIRIPAARPVAAQPQPAASSPISSPDAVPPPEAEWDQPPMDEEAPTGDGIPF